MKRLFFFLSALVYLTLLAVVSAPASPAKYGQIRALKRRAVTVVRQKNDFVARVLQSYNIPYQRNESGVVTRLQLDGRWFDVNRIEIVPLTREEGKGLHVVAHEIFFYTESEILQLVSAITIR